MTDNAVTVFEHFRIACMETRGGDPLGQIEDGSLVVEGPTIAWVGRSVDLPLDYRTAPKVVGQGKLLTPGLIDCHTHLVYGGTRVDDWRQRLDGVSYEEIARAGGGILSTVNATRSSTSEQLFGSALSRLKSWIAGGVTTVEVKSGYGLDLANEMKLLHVIQRLATVAPIGVLPTLLAAHAVPPEFRNNANAYVDLVCNEIIPAAATHCLAVDAFCERIAFDLKQTERVLTAALEYGKQIKLHAEQLSLMGGAALAARLGAVSADHLEYLDESGVREMASYGTVAVLLPGAFYFLREKQRPPLTLLRQHDVRIAVATDFNPGSSPLSCLLLAANMGAMLFGMTPNEVLLGITRNAAAAVGLESSIGSIRTGKRADFVCWDCQSPFELIYPIGDHPRVNRSYKSGQRIDDLAAPSP